MNLPLTPLFRQGMAHAVAPRISILAGAILTGSIKNAAGRFSLSDQDLRPAACLYRYPSPYGRPGSPNNRPPAFFPDIPRGYSAPATSRGGFTPVARRAAAVSRRVVIKAMEPAVRSRVLSPRYANIWGEIRCSRTARNGSWQPHFWAASQPVATRSVNKPSSAPVSAVQARPSRVAAWQPAPSSVLRPTSPTATSIRIAATDRAPAPRSEPGPARQNPNAIAVPAAVAFSRLTGARWPGLRRAGHTTPGAVAPGRDTNQDREGA